MKRSPYLCGLLRIAEWIMRVPLLRWRQAIWQQLTWGVSQLRRSYPTDVWNQYCVLQQRALQAYTRNPANVAGRTLMAMFIGVIGGLVFYKQPEGELLF